MPRYVVLEGGYVPHGGSADALRAFLRAAGIPFTERPSKRHPEAPTIVVTSDDLWASGDIPLRMRAMELIGDLRFRWNSRKQHYQALVCEEDREDPNISLLLPVLEEIPARRQHEQDQQAKRLLHMITDEERMEMLNRFKELITADPETRVSVVEFALDYFKDRLRPEC